MWMDTFGGWRGRWKQGKGVVGQEWIPIGRRSSTAALSYENLIVSHTKANRLSILRERLFLSGETTEWFARVALASLQLPPSRMFSLSFLLPLFHSTYLSPSFSLLSISLILPRYDPFDPLFINFSKCIIEYLT